MSHIICVTKKFVDDAVELMNESIECLKLESVKHMGIERDELHNLIKNAKSEMEIYKKVKAQMENEGSNTLCLESKPQGKFRNDRRKINIRREQMPKEELREKCARFLEVMDEAVKDCDVSLFTMQYNSKMLSYG